MPVTLDVTVADADEVKDELGDADAVALCVKVDIPLTEGERDAEGVPLDESVRL